MRPHHSRPPAGTPALTAWRPRPWRYHARHRADLCAVLAELTFSAVAAGATMPAIKMTCALSWPS